MLFRRGARPVQLPSWKSSGLDSSSPSKNSSFRALSGLHNRDSKFTRSLLAQRSLKVPEPVFRSGADTYKSTRFFSHSATSSNSESKSPVIVTDDEHLDSEGMPVKYVYCSYNTVELVYRTLLTSCRFYQTRSRITRYQCPPSPRNCGCRNPRSSLHPPERPRSPHSYF